MIFCDSLHRCDTTDSVYRCPRALSLDECPCTSVYRSRSIVPNCGQAHRRPAREGGFDLMYLQCIESDRRGGPELADTGLTLLDSTVSKSHPTVVRREQTLTWG